MGFELVAPSAVGGRARRRTLLVAMAVIPAVAVSLAVGMLVGSRLAASPAAVPADDSVDAGFARDMQTHHRQAVQMSTFVLEDSSDADVVILARDIQLTQQQQAGQMYGWLVLWGLRQGSTQPSMAWMSADDSTMTDMPGMQDTATPGSMPGLATRKQLQRLQQATGAAADRLYLELMIAHHTGGVAMGEAAAHAAQTPAVRQLAQSIVESQTAELAVLSDMLAARGGPSAA